jgi:hypothetical protein
MKKPVYRQVENRWWSLPGVWNVWGKKRKKWGVLPNTQSEREEALFLKSSKTPKSPALVFLACLFCILFCVVGLLRELGRAGSLARSLALSRFCAPNCWPEREKLSKPSSQSSIMCGILAVLGSYDKSAARRARILECSRRCVVFLLLAVLFLAVLFYPISSFFCGLLLGGVFFCCLCVC